MRTRKWGLFLLLFMTLPLSASDIDQWRLIGKDDYGLVTLADLKEEAKESPGILPFDPQRHEPFRYWQCLPTHHYSLRCEEIGENSETNGRLLFWIQDEVGSHHYLMPGSYDIQFCEDQALKLRSLIENEDKVCLLADSLGEQPQGEEGDGSVGPHRYWSLDRLKSRRGEWSYFLRGEELREAIAAERQEDSAPGMFEGESLRSSF